MSSRSLVLHTVPLHVLVYIMLYLFVLNVARQTGPTLSITIFAFEARYGSRHARVNPSRYSDPDCTLTGAYE